MVFYLMLMGMFLYPDLERSGDAHNASSFILHQIALAQKREPFSVTHAFTLFAYSFGSSLWLNIKMKSAVIIKS